MITLEANYSKKIGLPGYSSHQFSVTLKSELSDVSQVEQETARLYDVLQNSVDNNIQQVGFLPNQNGNGNGGGNGTGSNGHSNNGDVWKCSPKQKELILKIVDENRLNKNEVEALAKERFNLPVKTLNKLQASGLIKELLEKYPGNTNGAGNNRRQFQRAGGR
jgi:hypothetical protein